MRKILILASNPKRDLALDREIRDLEGVVKRSRDRDEFEVKIGSAVRPEDLQELLLEHEPQIVHFCGHGTGEQGLVLQNSAGRAQLVSTSALSSLFKLFTGKVDCVLLNACYSEVQANAISQHVNYVIGMSQTILDDAAIAFATGFYRGLGYGRTTEEAYHFGCNAIELMPSTTVISRSPTAPQERKLTAEFTVIPGAPIAIPEHLKPVLKTRQTLAAQSNSANIPAVPTSETKRVEIAEDVSKALEQEAALKQYRNCVRDFLADGVLTPEEKLRLGLLAKQLGLDPAEAIAIFQEEERLRFASVPPGRVAVATNSPIQPLFASETVAPARSQLKQLSLLLGGAGALLGLGIAIFSSHLLVKEPFPPTPVSPDVSGSPVSPISNPGSSSAQILETAKRQAKNGELVAAIATLATITQDQPNYGEATSLAQTLYSNLLKSLNEGTGECEAKVAIDTLKKIPLNSTVFSQTDINEWEALRNHFNQIGIDIDQNNIDAATTEASNIKGDYCKVEIVKKLLTVNKLNNARAVADKIGNHDENQKANTLITAHVPPPVTPPPVTPPPVTPPPVTPPSGIVEPSTGEQPIKPPCYRVNVAPDDPLKVRSDDDITDGVIGTAIGKLDRGTIVVSTEETQQAKHPDRPEVITWLKISQPVEGWVAKDNLSSSNDCPAAATGK